MLQHFGIIPFLVFDGDDLPSKAGTEAQRAAKREHSKRLGLELLQCGKTAQAYQELQKAIDVTPEMASQLVEELRRGGVKFIVAPYEADAQLAYLERKGVISGIISEDSDLLVFGAKCLITKLDQYGDCVVINRADFTACTEISLVGWSDAEFRQMAILSGCDYLASMNKMGLKTAYRLMRKYKTANRIVQAVQFDGQFRVPAGYLESFRRAELTFMHQRVFCPDLNKLVMFTDPEDDLTEELSFLGRDFEPGLAAGVANGDLHPMTKEPLPRIVSGRQDRPGPGMGNVASGDSKNLKWGKPIQEFFKAKRTPLAELDLNSFTPSPSQRRLLDQHSNASWTARSASSRPQTGVASNMLPRSNSHGVPGMPEDNSTSLPTARPSKRPRLCSDDNQGSMAAGEEKTKAVKSRFFAKTASPKNKKANRNIKKPEINIFSDDSVEDAMSRLPDDFTPMKPSRNSDFKVFVDAADHASHSTTVIHSTAKPGVKIAAGEPGPSTSAQIAAHTAAVPRNILRSLPASVQAERVVEAARQFSAVSSTAQAASTHSIRRVLKKSADADTTVKRSTTLERIGAMALKRSGSGSLQTTTSVSRVATSQVVLETGTSSDEGLAIETVTAKQAVSMSVSMQEGVRGSEDLMIPDSEVEDDGDILSPTPLLLGLE